MSQTISTIDAYLKAVYGPSKRDIAKARRDPRVREYIGLGGTAALDGVKEMVDCPAPIHKRPEREIACTCPEEGHDVHRIPWNCSLCKNEQEVWTGRWVKRPTRDRRKRRRLVALRKAAGWDRIYMAEHGDPIGNAINATVPFYAAALKQAKAR